MTTVFVCGYSCGLRKKESGNKNLFRWEHSSEILDLCWTCACYITDEGKIIYFGFCNDISPKSPSIESPTEPSPDNSELSDNKESEKAVPEQLVRCEPMDCSTGSDQHTCSWSLIANGGRFMQVVCGWRLLGAVTQQGKCLLWKDLAFDQPLLPDAENETIVVDRISLGDKYSALLSADGKAFQLFYDESGYTLKWLPVQQSVTQISCGKEHVVLLTQNGAVFTYGVGSRGQLGHGVLAEETEPRLVEALDGLKILSVAAGGWHSAALDAIGSVYMWGWNESGQLAFPCGKLNKEQGTTIALQSIPTLLTFPNDATVKKISLGSRHSAAMTGDGKLLTWGWNGYGQLCLGDTNIRDAPTIVEMFQKQKRTIHDVRCRDWSTIVWVSNP